MVRSLRSTAGDVTASVPPDYSGRVERDERFHSSSRGSVGGERGLSGRPEAVSGSLYARDTGDAHRYAGNVAALAVTNGSPDDLIVRVDGVRRSVSNFPSHPTA